MSWFPKGKMFTNKSSQSLNLYMKKEELPTTLCSMCKKWKNSLFMPILQEVCIILQQISIILLFWVFWLQYRTLKKFVDTTMGLMKSAEISLIFLKVCWYQYWAQFFVTSIGQVCWHEYVAPSMYLETLEIFFLFDQRKNWEHHSFGPTYYCLLAI